jgi:hypothetical protein
MGRGGTLDPRLRAEGWKGPHFKPGAAVREGIPLDPEAEGGGIEGARAYWSRRPLLGQPGYQLPNARTSPRQTASRSLASESLATLAFLAAAVMTMTSLSSGSTKIDWP